MRLRISIQLMLVLMSTGSAAPAQTTAVRPPESSRTILYITAAGQRADVPMELYSIPATSVEAIRPDRVPATAELLRKYDSIFFDNVRASAFSRAQMSAVSVACHDFGVGFCMVGGRNSFAIGGYRGTAIEAMLPISMNMKLDANRQDAAVVMVVEDSELPPMLEWPKEFCKSTAALLEPCDRFGVLSCSGPESYAVKLPDEDGTWLAPLAPVSDVDSLRFQIQKFNELGDPASYLPFLRRAYRALVKTEAKTKHIILVGDGDAVYEEHAADMQSVLKTIHAAGITVSTIVFNADKPEIQYMQQIAEAGGGKAYIALAHRDIASIAATDMSAIGQTIMRRGPVTAQAAERQSMFSGIDWVAMPRIPEYNAAAPKPDAIAELETAAHEPLVVGWQYGGGHVCALLFQPEIRMSRGTKWSSVSV